MKIIKIILKDLIQIQKIVLWTVIMEHLRLQLILVKIIIMHKQKKFI